MENSTILKPVQIHQIDSHCLQIVWSDGHDSRYETLHLRWQCRCANCVDEWNGKARLDRSLVPKDVHPIDIEAVGHYGLKFNWSDGHNTGIYSYGYLRDICECNECVKAVL